MEIFLYLQLQMKRISAECIMKRKENVFFAVVFFLFLAFAEKLFCQPYFDVANFYFQYSPDQSLINVDKNSLKTNYGYASIKFPVKLKNDLLVINTFYENIQINYGGGATQKLYGTGFFMTYLRQWKNEKWKTAFIAIPRINSDFENIDRNDFQIGGVVLGIYKKSETLSYKFGTYVNSDFFGPYIMPLIGMDWRPSEKVKFFCVLFSNLNFEYKISKRFYAGVEANFITNSYRYDDFYFLRIDDRHVKIYIDTYVTKNVVMSLHMGQSIFRKYQSGFRTDGKTDYTNLEVNDGLLIRTGLVYRIRQDKKKPE